MQPAAAFSYFRRDNRAQQNGAGDELLIVGRYAHQCKSIADGPQQQHRNRRTGQGSTAAVKRRSA